jgi:hypothetical protein
MKCALCRRPTERSLCPSCWGYSIDRLEAFPSKYKQLEGEMLPTQGHGERVGGSKTPPIPVRVETLHLRTGGISKPLMAHEAQIRIEQRHTRITFRGEEHNRIEITCKYLTAQSEWIFTTYKDVAKLATEVDSINKQINTVLGYRSDLLTIGTCPSVDDKGETCGNKLQINPATLTSFGDIKCRACNAVWSSEKWRLLGRVLSANSAGSDKSVQG